MIEKEYSLNRGELDFKEIYSVMGYGESVPEPSIVALVEEVCEKAYDICRMRYMCDMFEAEALSKRDLKIGNTVFAAGGIITSYLQGMTDACMFIATAGAEYHSYLHSFKRNGDILMEFIADSVGSVIAEKAVSRMVNDLVAKFPNLKISLPYSPGYCAWNVNQQKLLFAMFPEDPCGVHLTDSCLMFPEKSVSGFVALGEDLIPQPYKCGVCTNTKCYKNRIHHKPA